MYSKKCSCCGSSNIVGVINYGKIPLAGNFPKHSELSNVETYPCDLVICDDCGLLQVHSVVSPEILFKDYRYMSSYGLSDYFSSVAEYLDNRFNLSDKYVIEIGCNDGVLLKPLMDKGIQCLGYEPSNISKFALEKGCNVINDYFNIETVLDYKNLADLVVANNVFAHVDDLDSLIRGIKYVLKENGSFVCEVHYLLNLVEKLQYDFIYHEHVFYHSLYSLNNLFSRYDMTIYDFDMIDVHSGSIRVFVKNGIDEQSDKIKKQIEIEKKAGITNSVGLSNFSRNVSEHINSCLVFLKKLQGREVVGFGASGRANVFCNLLRLNTGLVKYIYDQSPERINRFLPIVNIPIIEYKNYEKEHDIVIIFAWNYSNMIVNKIKAKEYVIMFPTPKIFKKGETIDGVL